MKSNKVTEELTDAIPFISLPMKWRDMCYRFAKSKNISHNIIMKSKFKIGKFSKLVREIEIPE